MVIVLSIHKTIHKNSIREILINNKNWERYKLNHPKLEPYFVNEIERMLNCCNPEKGFFVGYCEKCRKDIVMHFKCNGKACSRCSKYYVDKWVKKVKKKILNEQHKLVSLTIPADLRKIFLGRWDLLKILQDSAYETLQIVAEKTLKKKVKVGILVGLQTYGQDLKFHPHLHCAVSRKVKFDEKFIDLKYIPSEFLRRTWRNVVVKNLRKANICYDDKLLVNSMVERYPNGFVTNVEESNNLNCIIRYLARYMRHPAISDSRIIFYGREKVVIRMKDKQRRNYSTWLYVEEFINRLIMHLPQKNFKIVRWYGIYSRKEARLTREKSKQESILPFVEVKNRIVRCPECKFPLKGVMFFINKPPNKKELMEKLNYWTD